MAQTRCEDCGGETVELPPLDDRRKSNLTQTRRQYKCQDRECDHITREPPQPDG